MLGLAKSVTTHRGGLLDLISLTERTNAVTGDPATVNVVF
jgi:hypothetical protein